MSTEQPGQVRRRLGQVTLPAMTGGLDTLWSLILDLAERVPSSRWLLIGGQMVMLHGLVAGRTPLRASRDVDLLADLLSARDGLQLCVRAVEDLRFEPSVDSGGRHVYRFVRHDDGAVIDVLAPDHSPPRWPLRTVLGKDTIQVEGGHQALSRAATIAVVKGDRGAEIPVPDLLGALVLKAAAWLIDSRGPRWRRAARWRAGTARWSGPGRVGGRSGGGVGPACQR